MWEFRDFQGSYGGGWRENRGSGHQTQLSISMSSPGCSGDDYLKAASEWDGVDHTHCCSGQLKKQQVEGSRVAGKVGVSLRAESRSRATQGLLCGWLGASMERLLLAQRQRDSFLGAVVYNVCIFAFGASEGRLNQGKWMRHWLSDSKRPQTHPRSSSFLIG